MATSNDIKNGSVLNIDGQLWSVTWFQHVKPGKGGAFVKTKIKNVVDGRVIERTYNAGAKLDFETVDRHNMQYLYKDSDNFVFMDPETYDQLNIQEKVAGPIDKYISEGDSVPVATNNGNPLYVDLPESVIVKIAYTEPGDAGNRANAGTKPATTESGLEIQVPLFINEGEEVKIRTEDNSYSARA
jgi:elongation factor P